MPQLNPSPWLAILLFSWLVFALIIPPKVMSHKYPYEPNLQNVKTPSTNPWTWKWH